jgi:hypothetical protein
MSRSARTMVVFGVYLLGLGAALMLAPNLVLGLFRVPATSEVWIRVVGVLAAIIGVYYLLAVRAGMRQLFAWSVPVRMAVAIPFGAFVLAGLVSPVLMLFASVDFAGAAWTWAALRREAAAAPPG